MSAEISTRAHGCASDAKTATKPQQVASKMKGPTSQTELLYNWNQAGKGISYVRSWGGLFLQDIRLLVLPLSFSFSTHASCAKTDHE